MINYLNRNESTRSSILGEIIMAANAILNGRDLDGLCKTVEQKTLRLVRRNHPRKDEISDLIELIETPEMGIIGSREKSSNEFVNKYYEVLRVLDGSDKIRDSPFNFRKELRDYRKTQGRARPESLDMGIGTILSRYANSLEIDENTLKNFYKALRSVRDKPYAWELIPAIKTNYLLERIFTELPYERAVKAVSKVKNKKLFEEYNLGEVIREIIPKGTLRGLTHFDDSRREEASEMVKSLFGYLGSQFLYNKEKEYEKKLDSTTEKTYNQLRQKISNALDNSRIFLSEYSIESKKFAGTESRQDNTGFYDDVAIYDTVYNHYLAVEGTFGEEFKAIMNSVKVPAIRDRLRAFSVRMYLAENMNKITEPIAVESLWGFDEITENTVRYYQSK